MLALGKFGSAKRDSKMLTGLQGNCNYNCNGHHVRILLQRAACPSRRSRRWSPSYCLQLGSMTCSSWCALSSVWTAASTRALKKPSAWLVPRREPQSPSPPLQMRSHNSLRQHNSLPCYAELLPVGGRWGDCDLCAAAHVCRSVSRSVFLSPSLCLPLSRFPRSSSAAPWPASSPSIRER